MGSLFDLSNSFVDVIIDQFVDVCDVIDQREVQNSRGQLAPDPASPVVASNVPCFYERYGNRRFEQLSQAQVISASVSHRILLRVTSDTMKIKDNFIIKVKARGDRPELTFIDLQRLDESLSPLLIVGANLSNQ